MKQKVLPLLLVLPFVIAVLSALSIQFAVNIISEDLSDIEWSYRQNEGFKVSTRTQLHAKPIGSQSALADPLNELTWTIETEEDVDYQDILEKTGSLYYFTPREVGRYILTCTNIRGTVAKSINAYVYDGGVILVNPRYSSSQGIEGHTYIGQYDFSGDGYTNAQYPLTVEAVPTSLNSQIELINISEGITFENNILTINEVSNKTEKKELNFSINVVDVPDQTFAFTVVRDGFNVYDYSELLRATKTNDPKIIVQQRHFESLEKTYDQNGKLKNEDTTLFGNYDFKLKTFNFSDEVYRFTTTYSKKYIDDWNRQNQDKISNKVLAGIHIQKDFYGNGFRLNGHNLTYPYDTTTNNKGVKIATLNDKNLFRGPLTFVALGSPNETPLINAYGQDNTLLYVSGDGITLRDLNMSNADFGNNLNNLNYTGTGIEVNGNNVMIINSQVKNARTGIRLFSNNNTTIKNSFISTTRQFLISIGSNEYETPNPNKTGTIYDAEGNILNGGTTSFTNYFRYPDVPVTTSQITSLPTTTADGLITNYLISSGDGTGLLEQAVKSLDNLINQRDLVEDESGNSIFKTNVTIEDTYFYQSGIASIALETMFNGPFLYNALPSIVSSLLGDMVDGVKLSRIGGVAYPAKVNLVGDTSFFDYKAIGSIDVNSLIGENISPIINETGFGDGKIYSIDDIFPIRSLIANTATANGYSITESKDETIESYINLPIIYYGGGLNLSEIDTSQLNNKELLSDKIELNLLNHVINNPASDMLTKVMQRTVLTATGFAPFYYHAYKDSFLYQVNPNINQLKTRAQSEV